MKNQLLQYKTIFFVSGLIVLFVVLSAYRTGLNNKATISVHIDNLGKDSVFIVMCPFHESPRPNFDTIIAQDGKFKFDTNITELHYGVIMSNKMFKIHPNGEKHIMRSNYILFFIRPGEHIEITGKILKINSEYEIKGNKYNDQYSNYTRDLSQIVGSMDSISYLVASAQIKKSPDSIITSLKNQFEILYEQYKDVTLSYIRKHPENEISAYLLFYEFRYEKEVIMTFLPDLHESVKQSPFGKTLQELVSIWNNTNIGCYPPEFEAKISKNKTISLKDYKGKHLILHFWATWCGPCINDLPKLNDYYNEYNKYFNIISIAGISDYEKWDKLISENKLKWPQVFDEKGKNAIYKKYDITIWPTKFLIDPDGIIVRRFNNHGEFYDCLDSIIIAKRKRGLY